MKINLLLIWLTLLVFKSMGQANNSDSLFYQNSVQNTIAQYHQNIGYQSKLFNGNQYASYPFPFKVGHPFYNSDEFVTGSLEYNQVLFPNVKLLYNEVSDVLIIKDITHFTQLISEKVSRFSIHNSQFIRLENDNFQNSLKMPSGFFQILFDGNVKAYLKEKKIIIEDITSASEGIKRLIVVKNSFFVKKDNIFHTINRKNDFLNLFENNKKEINDFIKENKLNFKENKMEYISKVTAFYDQLPK